jgi:23S rRNA-/tRNA-specific pseudouridylate synthase
LLKPATGEAVGKRLDVFLSEQNRQFLVQDSVPMIRMVMCLLIRKPQKVVTVYGKPMRFSNPRTRIAVAIQPENIPLDVLYEDEISVGNQ